MSKHPCIGQIEAKTLIIGPSYKHCLPFYYETLGGQEFPPDAPESVWRRLKIYRENYRKVQLLSGWKINANLRTNLMLAFIALQSTRQDRTFRPNESHDLNVLQNARRLSD